MHVFGTPFDIGSHWKCKEAKSTKHLSHQLEMQELRRKCGIGRSRRQKEKVQGTGKLWPVSAERPAPTCRLPFRPITIQLFSAGPVHWCRNVQRDRGSTSSKTSRVCNHCWDRPDPSSVDPCSITTVPNIATQ